MSSKTGLWGCLALAVVLVHRAFGQALPLPAQAGDDAEEALPAAASSALHPAPPPGLDPALAGSVRARYGHLLLAPATEDSARAILAWGKLRFEEAEGIWARLHPQAGEELPADPDSTFLIDYLRGVELLEAAETADDARQMIRHYEQARAAFDAVLAKDARNREARDHLVLCLERLAEAFESATLYRKAATLYRNLIAHQDRSSWYYHFRLMLVEARLGRDYQALETGYLAEDLLLQQAAGLLPAPASGALDRAEARRARATILRTRWEIERKLGLFDALLITAGRLQVTQGRRERGADRARVSEYQRAMAWDPRGGGHDAFYRHLELVRAYNGGRHQQAYLGWRELREAALAERARLVLDYYLALVERNHLQQGGEALGRLYGWWERYRDRQRDLAALGARYLSSEDHPDGTYLLEDFGAACEARGRELMESDRTLALAYFEQSSRVLWSRRAAAAYNAAALLPEQHGEPYLLRARRDLLIDLDPEGGDAAAPLAAEHRDRLRDIAPRIYEDLLLLARRSGRHSWIEPLREELAQIRAEGHAARRFDPPIPARGES